MINIEKGRYWSLPWSLVSGCTPCSPGCERCWSAAIAHRFGSYTFNAFTTRTVGYPPQFTGQIETHPERLDIPLKRKKPTVFSLWNDLFHEAVPDSFRHEAYSMMALCRHHTFLVLTKRADGMARYFSVPRAELATRWFEARKYRKDRTTLKPTDCGTWPETGIPNVYHGVTICNQQELVGKIADFYRVPGKKFLSLEPLLGPVITRPLFYQCECGRIETEHGDPSVPCKKFSPAIKQAILGGETGAGARPMHPDWVRSVRDQCAAAGVPFFFKGWGAWKGSADFKGAHMVPGTERKGRLLDGRTHDELAWRSS